METINYRRTNDCLSTKHEILQSLISLLYRSNIYNKHSSTNLTFTQIETNMLRAGPKTSSKKNYVT